MEDPRAKFWKAYADTAPDKITPDKMSDETLRAMHAYFLDGYSVLHDEPEMFHAAEARIALLSGQISERKTFQQNAAHHKEAQTLGQKTLFWAKVGGIAAAIGTLVLLGQELPISRLRPSTSSQASPASSPQTTASVALSATPKAAESSSGSPQASQTPSPTPAP